MKKRFNPSIFKALALLMVVVMLLMLTVQAVFLFKYRHAVIEKEIKSLDTIALQACTSVRYELDSISTSGISSFRNRGIVDVLEGRTETKSDGENALNEIIGLNRSIVAAYLLDMDLNCLCFSARDHADVRSAENLLGLAEAGDINGTHTVVSEDGEKYFSYMQPVIFR